MEQKNLIGTVRNELRSKASGQLRRQGRIPAIIYGHQAPLTISIDAHEFKTKFRIISENVIIKLSVDGNTYDVLVKDFQENLIKDQIIHIDFFEIERGKLLKTHIPIHIEGTARGVKLGGIFEALMHDVEVECLPKDLPERINVNISDLDVGNSVHVSDLTLGDAVKIINPMQQVICHVIRKRETVETTEGEAEETVEDTEGKE